MITLMQSSGPRVLATDWLPLNRAALCLDCETVYPLSAIRCPRCDGAACVALSKWLERRKPTNGKEVQPCGREAERRPAQCTGEDR
jgi:hypothetical protein